MSRSNHSPSEKAPAPGTLGSEVDMIAASHFRRGGSDGREALAAPGDITSIAKNYTPQQQFSGTVTSKRPARLSRADLELVAFRLGCSLATARRAIELGLV